MICRKLKEGLVWNKASRNDEFRWSLGEASKRWKGLISLVEGYSMNKNLELEVNWLEWRSCIKRF